jgi:hypothetical protein
LYTDDSGWPGAKLLDLPSTTFADLQLPLWTINQVINSPVVWLVFMSQAGSSPEVNVAASGGYGGGLPVITNPGDTPDTAFFDFSMGTYVKNMGTYADPPDPFMAPDPSFNNNDNVGGWALNCGLYVG